MIAAFRHQPKPQKSHSSAGAALPRDLTPGHRSGQPRRRPAQAAGSLRNIPASYAHLKKQDAGLLSGCSGGDRSGYGMRSSAILAPEAAAPCRERIGRRRNGDASVDIRPFRMVRLRLQRHGGQEGEGSDEIPELESPADRVADRLVGSARQRAKRRGRFIQRPHIRPEPPVRSRRRSFAPPRPPSRCGRCRQP